MMCFILLIHLMFILLSNNINVNSTNVPTQSPTKSLQEVKNDINNMKSKLTGDLGTGLDALKSIVTRIQNIASATSDIADYTEDVADVVNEIKDTAPDVLDNVEAFFDKLWFEWPTSSTDDASAYKLLEAFEALFAAIGIDFPDLDIGFFFKLIDFPLTEIEWIDYINAAAVTIKKIIASAGGIRRRRLESEPEQSELTSNCSTDDYIICDMSLAIYTEGIWYEYVVLTPLTLDLSTDISSYVDIGNTDSGSIATDTKSYTDGNLLAFFKLIHHILSIYGDHTDTMCEAAVDCADPLITDAFVSPICNAFVKVLKYVTSWFAYILENADYHDALVTSTQLQAIFDDRIIQIKNQMKMKNFLQFEFSETKELTVKQIDEFTVSMNKRFNTTRKLFKNEIIIFTQIMNNNFDLTNALIIYKIKEFTELMNDRFNNTRELIENRFHILTSYLNMTFTDMFSRLTEIDKLLRTPNGKRDGWNEQTFSALSARSRVDVDIFSNNDKNDKIVYKIHKKNYYIAAFIVGFVYLMLSIILIIDQIILCWNRKNVKNVKNVYSPVPIKSN